MTRDQPLPAEVEAKILEAYPTRGDASWDVLEERVVLAVPKRFSGLDRLLQRFVPGPSVAFLRLDAIGSLAWLACDGSRTGRDVAEAIRERFGEEAEPAESRAASFVAKLMSQGLLRAFDEPVVADDAGRGFTPERGFDRVTCKRCAREHPVKREPGVRYVCPGCGKVARVPRGRG